MSYFFGVDKPAQGIQLSPYGGFDYSLINDDCLKGMSRLPDRCVDIVFADLPYGYTNAPWDQMLPFHDLWDVLNRVCKEDAAMVFTARNCKTGTFASDLIQSNKANFEVEWVWDKMRPGHGLNAKWHPLKRYENVLVFCRGKITYNPQIESTRVYQRPDYVSAASVT